MSAVFGHHIGKDLVDCLKLPKQTVSATLRFAVNDVVSVTCVFYPEHDDVRTLLTKLKSYELHESLTRFDVGHEIVLAERAAKDHT